MNVIGVDGNGSHERVILYLPPTLTTDKLLGLGSRRVVNPSYKNPKWYLH